MHFCLLTSATLASHPASANCKRIVWDAWDVEENDISLCREMNARLITLRSEPHQGAVFEISLPLETQ